MASLSDQRCTSYSSCTVAIGAKNTAETPNRATVTKGIFNASVIPMMNLPEATDVF